MNDIEPWLDKMGMDVSESTNHIDTKLEQHATQMTGIITKASYLNTWIINQATRITDIETEHRAQVNKQENAVTALRTTIALSRLDHTFHPTTNSWYVTHAELKKN